MDFTLDCYCMYNCISLPIDCLPSTVLVPRTVRARSMANHNQADHIHRAMSGSPLRRLGPRYTQRRGMLEGRGAAVSDLRKSSSGGFTATRPSAPLASFRHLPSKPLVYRGSTGRGTYLALELAVRAGRPVTLRVTLHSAGLLH